MPDNLLQYVHAPLPAPSLPVAYRGYPPLARLPPPFHTERGDRLSLRIRGPARAEEVIDLALTTPTLLPDILRSAAEQALAMAADPLNALDDNPYIGREWSAVALELSAVAKSLETRVYLLLTHVLDQPDV